MKLGPILTKHSSHLQRIRYGVGVLALVMLIGCHFTNLKNSVRSWPEGERIVWFSTNANKPRLLNREAVSESFRKCKQSGLTSVVVDIEANGYLTYPSSLGSHFSQMEASPFAEDYDLLSTSVAVAHQQGLRCLVSYFGTHRYPLKDEWRFVHYEGLKPGEGVNPFLPEVKQRYFAILKEVLERYEVDGILLDGIRYRGFNTDFSDWSRKRFEEFVRKPVGNWPEDILTFRPVSKDHSSVVPGPLFKQWAKYRAQEVKDYFIEVREVVEKANPKVWFGDYVGSWYPDYASLGANWASENFEAGYDWMTEDYHTTGYADLLDFLAVGLYYPRVTLQEARQVPTKDYYCVEGAAELAEGVVAKRTSVIGTLYLLQYKDNPEQFIKAVRMASSLTEGVGIFDAVYLAQYDWWDELGYALGVGQEPTESLPK